MTMRAMILPHISIIGIYRSPRVAVHQLCETLDQILTSLTTEFNIFIGDFNINCWMKGVECPCIICFSIITITGK